MPSTSCCPSTCWVHWQATRLTLRRRRPWRRPWRQRRRRQQEQPSPAAAAAAAAAAARTPLARGLQRAQLGALMPAAACVCCAPGGSWLRSSLPGGPWTCRPARTTCARGCCGWTGGTGSAPRGRCRRRSSSLRRCSRRWPSALWRRSGSGRSTRTAAPTAAMTTVTTGGSRGRGRGSRRADSAPVVIQDSVPRGINSFPRGMAVHYVDLHSIELLGTNLQATLLLLVQIKEGHVRSRCLPAAPDRQLLGCRAAHSRHSRRLSTAPCLRWHVTGP